MVTRVTRWSDFFTLGNVLNYKSDPKILGIRCGKSFVLTMARYGLGYILGDFFFTKTSGHTDGGTHFYQRRRFSQPPSL
jgi:hypothetical protein